MSFASRIDDPSSSSRSSAALGTTARMPWSGSSRSPAVTSTSSFSRGVSGEPGGKSASNPTTQFISPSPRRSSRFSGLSPRKTVETTGANEAPSSAPSGRKRRAVSSGTSIIPERLRSNSSSSAGASTSIHEHHSAERPRKIISGVENPISARVAAEGSWENDLEILTNKAGQSSSAMDNVLKVLQQAQHFDIARVKMILSRSSPFSKAKYADMITFFDQFPAASEPFDGWDELDIQTASLPRSIQLEIGLRILEGKTSLGGAFGKTEAARVNLTTSINNLLLSLWGGVLQDRPEAPMPATLLSSGGRVEREVYVQTNTSIHLGEYKTSVTSDTVAQAMCEMFSAAQINRMLGFPTVRIRTYITDVETFRYLQYDPQTNRFSKSKRLCLSKNAINEQIVAHFQEVANMQFTVLLESYVEVVSAYTSHSRCRMDKQNHGSHEYVHRDHQPIPPPMSRHEPSRASYKDWELTLNHAFWALKASQQATEVSSDSWAEEALKCLQESLEHFPARRPHHDYQFDLLSRSTMLQIIQNSLDSYLPSNNPVDRSELPATPSYLFQNLPKIETGFFKAVIWLEDDLVPIEIKHLPFPVKTPLVQLDTLVCIIREHGLEWNTDDEFSYYHGKHWMDVMGEAKLTWSKDEGYVLLLKRRNVTALFNWKNISRNKE